MRDPYSLVGRVFRDRYELVEYAGGGGMGAVYKSIDVISGAVIAIKILKPDILVMHPEFARLFSQEVKAAQELDHTNIVKVLDSGITDDGLSFMVMEWLEGQTLEQLIATTTLSITRVQSLFTQICSAVEAAHAHRIIHLDLKPANVFIIQRTTAEESVKVIDFGMARILRSESGTTVTRFLGTYQYCSPEHFGGKVSHRSDVYSLGVTLYHMFAGTLPFGASYIHAKMNPGVDLPPVPSVHNARPDVPTTVDEAIRKALSKNSGDRYASVTELLTAVDRALSGCEKSSDFFKIKQLKPQLTRRRRLLTMSFLGFVLLMAFVGIYWRIGKQLQPVNTRELFNQPAPTVDVANNYRQENLSTPPPSGNASQERLNNNAARNGTPNKVITLRLSPVYFLSGRRMQSIGMPVTVVTGSFKRTELVSAERSVTFKSVPCGAMVTVILSDNSYNGGIFPQKKYQRLMHCEKPILDLGDVEVPRQ